MSGRNRISSAPPVAALRLTTVPRSIRTNQLAPYTQIGNDKARLIQIISPNIPSIGYPRSLNALRCLNEAARKLLATSSD